MRNERYFLFIFCIVSFLLIAYGFYTDINTKKDFSFYTTLGLMLSLTSSVLGIIFVVYEVLERKVMFIISICASLSMILYLLFWSPLIWDFMLSLGYLCISIYGLYYWSNKEQKEKQATIPTQMLTIQKWILLILIAVLGTSLLAKIGIHIGKYTSPNQAIADAFTTTISIIGQVLLSRKYLEAWYMWILTNSVSVPLYISIGSYTYGALFLCYLVISFYGFFIWKSRMQAEQYRRI